ncbi:MAG: thioredoxin family protein [Candidatus Thorarchaeota archaeon]|jgi:thiol-disulfide isomerase/thioredoxin
MMFRNQLDAQPSLDAFHSESASLKINVFTSSSCTFCQEALDAAREVAEKFNSLNLPVDVVETSVEEQPNIIEEYNAIALPMVLVGSSQIIGLPRTEDIEFMIHQLMLAG